MTEQIERWQHRVDELDALLDGMNRRADQLNSIAQPSEDDLSESDSLQSQYRLVESEYLGLLGTYRRADGEIVSFRPHYSSYNPISVQEE